MRWNITLLIALSLASRAGAQDATTQSAGGTGGDAFSIGCGSGKAMVGVQGRNSLHVPLGDFVNTLQPLCVAVDTDGRWMGDPSPSLTAAGVNEGRFVSLQCPTHTAVHGISGRAGIYVNRLQILCAFVGEYGHLANDVTVPAFFIGDFVTEGGTPFGPFLCPDNKPGKGLSGKARDWIDRVALVCNFPSVPKASLQDMHLSGRTITGGGTITGTVTLNASAPAGGTPVDISRGTLLADASKIPANPIPVPPAVAAGQRSATFVFNTNPVDAPVNVVLIGNASGSVGHGLPPDTLQILPASVTSLSLSPPRTLPGAGVTGTITLSGRAGPGGVTASLTSSVGTAAIVPPTVTVPTDQTTATFPVTVTASAAACSVITVSGFFTPVGGAPSRQAPLVINAPGSPPFRLTMPPGPAPSLTATILFTTEAKVPHAMTLTSSNPALASVPAAVTMPANSTSATFTISVPGVSPSGMNCAVITVRDGNDVGSLTVLVDGSGVRRGG